MDFSLSNMGLNNLFENGHNFITFSVMGMLIVFCGLSIISIYIILLPKTLGVPSRIKEEKATKRKEKETEVHPVEDPELLLAIAVALHLEQTNTGNFERITWERSAGRESAWLTAGRIRGLAVRSHLPDHRS